MGNANETPACFDRAPSYTTEEIGTEFVIVKKTLGNEKVHVAVLLAALADGMKLPPYVIPKRKTMPKEQLPTGIIARCQNQDRCLKT